jgi:hypothetical protein
MPFGIPSEDFCGGFGLPHEEDFEPIETKSQKENNKNIREELLHYVAENFIAPLANDQRKGEEIFSEYCEERFNKFCSFCCDLFNEGGN